MENKQPSTQKENAAKNKKDIEKVKKQRIDVEKYQNAEINCLSKQEKEVFLLRLSGLTYQEIADKMNKSVNAVGTILWHCRNKLEGKESWYEKNREYISEKNRNKRKNAPEFVKKHTESQRKWSIKNEEKLREYNKRYYREHKEEILARQRRLKEEKKNEKIQEDSGGTGM